MSSPLLLEVFVALSVKQSAWVQVSLSSENNQVSVSSNFIVGALSMTDDSF